MLRVIVILLRFWTWLYNGHYAFGSIFSISWRYTVTIYGHNIIVFLPSFCLGIQKFHDALEQHELRWEFVFVFNLITSNVFVIISSNAISKQTRRHGSAAFLNSTTCQRCSCWLRVLDSWPEAYFNIKSSHVSNFYGQDDKLTFLFSHFASVGDMLF